MQKFTRTCRIVASGSEISIWVNMSKEGIPLEYAKELINVSIFLRLTIIVVDRTYVYVPLTRLFIR